MKVYSVICILLTLSLVLNCNGAKKTADNNTNEHLLLKASAAEIIVEATVIAENRWFFDSLAYSSRLLEVNAIFKGEVTEQVIEVVTRGNYVYYEHAVSEHPYSLPRLYTTAIFKLNEILPDDSAYGLQEAGPFKVYRSLGNPQVLFPKRYREPPETNLERDLYQRLERWHGQKRKIVLKPATRNEVAMNYSMKNGLTVPNRKIGLLYELGSIPARKKGQLGFGVYVSSTNTIAYWQQGAIDISYGETIFGDSIVSKGLLDYEIPISYKYDVYDTGRNSFRITWENTNEADSSIQLFPDLRRVRVANLYITPKEVRTGTGLQMRADTTHNLRYDYSTGQTVPFEYVATPTRFWYQVTDYIVPIIDNILPDQELSPLDTFAVSGKHFDRGVDIYLPTMKEERPWGYQKIPRDHIVYKSDTLVRAVIPLNFIVNMGERGATETLTPGTGPIRLVKDYTETGAAAWSEATLKIKGR